MTKKLTLVSLSAAPVLGFLLSLVLPAAAGAQGVATRAEEIRYPALRPFDIPQPQRVVLDNGMVVLLIEDHELPLVEATALVRAGSRSEPADKLGLANLAANVLRAGGTTKMPSDPLDDFLESRAATIEARADNASTTVSLSALRQDFPDVLRLFADVLRRPAFDPQRLEVARNQAIGQISRQNDNPFQITFREFPKLVYGADSPYARSANYATLRAIRRDDLVAWHRARFQPDRIVLGLSGDFRTDEALALVREVFGDWQRGAAEPPAEIPYRKTPAPGVYFAEKPGAPQSQVMMGHLGVERNDPDYYALEVGNEVLSGSFASRLFSSVRTRQGLAYTVFGGIDADWDHPGMARLFVNTKKETTGAGIAALLAEARKIIKDEPPTDAEVAKAKQGLLNAFVFNSDSPRSVLTQQLYFEFYGYPLDWLERYRAGIEAATPDQVRQAMARHLRPDEFAILVVGPSQGTDRPLTDFGKVSTVDLSLPGASAAPGQAPAQGKSPH
jgi:zinc protease